MNIDTNFFKSIYNNDIIFHYTKASTAIDFILYNNQLQFNGARKSYDPETGASMQGKQCADGYLCLK
jgi:hypothetical protein